MSWDRLSETVPRTIAAVATWTAAQRIEEAGRCADIIASGADVLCGRDGAAARADITAATVWDAISTGLAILACRPGGVGFDGMHWHSAPGSCAGCPGPGTLPLFGPASRAAIGAVFTPPGMASDLVASALPVVTSGQTLSPADDIKTVTVLDPFCGTGALLVAAARHLAAALAAAWDDHDQTEVANLCTLYGTSDPVMAARALIITRCLYGVDRDPVSVELAGLALQLLAPECPTDHVLEVDDYVWYVATDICQDPLSWHARLVRPAGAPTARMRGLRCGDSFVGQAWAPLTASCPADSTRFDWPAAFPEVADSGGFRAVVTNPPYLGGNSIPSVCGRRYRDHLIEAIAGGRRAFVDLAVYGWLRSHQLVSRHGVVAILGPDALLQAGTNYDVADACLASVGWRTYRTQPDLRWQTGNAAVRVCMAWTYRWGGAAPQDDVRNVPEGGPDAHLWELKETIEIGTCTAEVDGELVEVPQIAARWAPKDQPRPMHKRRPRKPRPAARPKTAAQ